MAENQHAQFWHRTCYLVECKSFTILEGGGLVGQPKSYQKQDRVVAKKYQGQKFKEVISIWL